MASEVKMLENEKGENRFTNNEFLKKYSSALLLVSATLKKERPDYILALSRKGPRLLELLRILDMWLENIPIISEKALDFIPPRELQGKKIIVFDDIIILGTTVKDLLSKLVKKYDVDIKLVCLAIDKETIKLDNDGKGNYWVEVLKNGEKKRILLDYKVPLSKDERFLYCNEIVRSFIFLNKSYDMDYPIFYASLRPDIISSLVGQSMQDKAYDLTTIYQANNGYCRYTFIPIQKYKIDKLFSNLFKKFSLCPQIYKVRVYFDEETNKAALVPMVTFGIDSKLLEEEIFSGFPYYNNLIDKARKLVSESKEFIESEDTRRPLYRLFWYLVNYLYGLSFILRNLGIKECFASFSVFQILHHQDLFYLFGPSFTRTILDFLDSYFTQTISELENSFNDKIFSSQVHERPSPKNRNQTAFDEEREELYEKIKSYLTGHLSSNDALTNQIATIFEALYECVELETQQQAKVGITGVESKRLGVGFNYNQIKEILLERHGIISQATDEMDLKFSLALDFLVDAGIQIPIFYYRKDGFFERAYRYGEDEFSAKRYGYTVASVVKNLFDYMKNSYKRDTLPQISFEKIGVILEENISLSGEIIDILRWYPDPNDRRLIISPTYSRHGKILHISDVDYEESESPRYPLMFVEWCEKEGIIQGVNKGVKYSNKYISKLKLLDGYPPKLVHSNHIAKLSRMAMLLYDVERISDKQSDFLIALTTCDHKSYLEALREELKLFFESKNYAFSIPLTMTSQYLGNKEEQTIKKLKEINTILSAKSHSAAHEIRHKNDLWNNFYKIKEKIEDHFSNQNLECRLAYEEKLKPYIDNKKILHDLPMDAFVLREKLKLISLGKLCILLSTILKCLLGLVIKISEVRIVKSGRFHKSDLKTIYNKMNELYETMGKWNSEIENQLSENLAEYSINELSKFNNKPPLLGYDIQEGIRLMEEIVPHIQDNYKKLKKIYDDNFSLPAWEIKRKMMDDSYGASEIEIKGMYKATAVSKKCKSEDNRVHPKVGAVIIKGNKIICDAYRGELEPGEHAEITAFKKCGNMDLSGATLITTLEPCMIRTHEKPCALRVLDRGIKKVLVGILDPNPDIRGKGILFLQRNKIETELFPANLANEVMKINRDFLDEEWKKYKIDLMREITESEWKKHEDEVKGDFYDVQKYIIKIYEVLNKRLNEEELVTLCRIYLGVDYDNLEGKTKFGKITDLIYKFKLMDKVGKLLDGIKNYKPELWEEIWGKIELPEYVIAEDEHLKKTIESKLRSPESEGLTREIMFKYKADTEKEWIRFCLVQLDFSLKYSSPPSKFSIILEDEDEVKDKVFEVLKIAEENKVDVICFPELGFSEKWIGEVKNHYGNMIIIGGSYYDEDSRNVCPIIINGEEITPLYKIQPSPIENPESTGRGMKSGNHLYIFQTACGRFSVLSCSDFNLGHTSSILNYFANGRKGVDFIINPRYEENMMRAQELANTICRESSVSIIQVNRASQEDKYGKSCIIAKEHDKLLVKYQKDGVKPPDDIKYKLCQLEGEAMLIASLNLKAPPIEIPLNYPGRLKIEKVYKYDTTRKKWISS
ncbi:MAG: deaminase [Thermoproteota archaeon]